MDHKDHVDLIQKGVTPSRGTWADFGSGRGAFTLALADILRGEGKIYSIDRDRGKLEAQKQRMQQRYPEVDIRYLVADYREPLELPALDGIVIANALHFQQEKGPVLALLHGYLRPSGTLILIEYNADHGNHWVPYPLSFPRWKKLAARYGFQQTQLLETKPSRFLGEIYAAASKKGEKR